MATTKVVKNGVNEGDMIIHIPEDYSMDIDRSDIKIPSILLWQKMSDMAEFESDNVQAGNFVNPITGDIYTKGFEGIVIRYYTTARIWGEKDEKTGRKEVMRFSRDGVHWDDDGSTISPAEFKWQEDGSHAVKSYHYLVLPKNSDIPCMISFKGSSAKFAKALNANLMFMKPSWRSWFKFYSTPEERNGNKYHVMQAKAQPKNIVNGEIASKASELWENTKTANVHSTDMDADQGAEEFSSDK